MRARTAYTMPPGLFCIRDYFLIPSQAVLRLIRTALLTDCANMGEQPRKETNDSKVYPCTASVERLATIICFLGMGKLCFYKAINTKEY